MSERDPRVDPRAGDALRVSGKIRCADSDAYIRIDGALMITYSPFSRGVQGEMRSCSLAAWRRWAKDAEVLRRGKDD
jgi:hypothetical protein